MNPLTLTLKSGKTITASASRGNKPANWQPAGHHYRVLVTNDRQKTKAWFDYWDSFHSAQTGQPCDIRGALSCFASDAMTGQNAEDAADIMHEFGYTNPKEARRVFTGCKEAERKANRLGLDWDDLAELADY